MCVSCAVESDAAGVFSFAALYRAYRACRRRKRHTRDALRYEARLLDRLVDTAQVLQAGTWRPSHTLCFAVGRPKAREIHAAPFADRVVHHLLVPHLEALYEPLLIHDLYSNRRGRGTHAAVARLQCFMGRLAGAGGPRTPVLAPPRGVPGAVAGGGWYLQLDLANFFNSIDRRRLFGLLRRRIRQAAAYAPDAEPLRRGGGRLGCAVRERGLTRNDLGRLLWLCRLLLTGNPAGRAREVGDPDALARVPPHKRLKHAAPERGLPIGNLTSQFFANVYLNELDQFVKQELKCRHYLRYVDDFVLLHRDPAQLLAWRDQIGVFLERELGLALRDPGRLRPVADGVDFLGYIVRPRYRLVRRRVVGNLEEHLGCWGRRLCPDKPRGGPAVASHPKRSALRGSPASSTRDPSSPEGVGLTGAAPIPPTLYPSPGRPPGVMTRLRLESTNRDALQATLASYLGHLRHADSAGLRARLWQRHPWLAALCQATPEGALRPRWEPRSVSGLRSQWRHFECYEAQAQWLRAQPAVRGLPVRVAVRAPFGDATSLPLGALAALLRRLRRAGVAYLWVAEQGYLRRGLRRRVARELFCAGLTGPERVPTGEPGSQPDAI